MRYITEWSVKFDAENIDITNTRATIKLAPVDPETWKPHREFKDNWDDTEKAYMKAMPFKELSKKTMLMSSFWKSKTYRSTRYQREVFLHIFRVIIIRICHFTLINFTV